MREGGKAGGRGEEREREVTETIIQENGHVSDEREVEICVETVHCPPPLHLLRGIIMQWLRYTTCVCTVKRQQGPHHLSLLVGMSVST